MWGGVPLRMHRMNPECLDSDPSGLSIAVTILLRNFFSAVLYQSLTEAKFLTVLTRAARVRYS